MKKPKLPKGFKVTVYKVPEKFTGRGMGEWFDCRIWKDGMLIISNSGTMFESREKAREYGVWRLLDLQRGPVF